MVILDTSVIVDHLRQTGKISHLEKFVSQKSKESLALSVVSVQELYEGKSTKDEEKEKYLLATIAPLKILPYSYEIAQMAGEMARELKYSIDLADAAIGATAIINNCSLYTLDKKHFKGVKGLELVQF